MNDIYTPAVEVVKYSFETAKPVHNAKFIIVLNGKGGVGKDTLVDFLRAKYNVAHESSITPIKQCAATIGYVGGKTMKDRKFLHDLKELVVEYNNYPTVYLKKVVEDFMNDNKNNFLFIDIREVEEIKRFIETIRYKVYTLLITRKEIDETVYGNKADDDVANYDYDMVYANDYPYHTAKYDFITFIDKFFDIGNNYMRNPITKELAPIVKF